MKYVNIVPLCLSLAAIALAMTSKKRDGQSTINGYTNSFRGFCTHLVSTSCSTIGVYQCTSGPPIHASLWAENMFASCRTETLKLE
jgi:hypothetical protein